MLRIRTTTTILLKAKNRNFKKVAVQREFLNPLDYLSSDFSSSKSSLAPISGAPTLPENRSAMSPLQMVEYLDRFIIGQTDAKKAVVNALRHRWRRMQLSPEKREEITPRNLLLVGPTGVGKTEIARRLAKLVDVPFIKVEATKFTEVGFYGRDVDSIITDLVDVALKNEKAKVNRECSKIANIETDKYILKSLFGPDSEGMRDETGDIWRNLSEQLRRGSLDHLAVHVKGDLLCDYKLPLRYDKGERSVDFENGDDLDHFTIDGIKKWTETGHSTSTSFTIHNSRSSGLVHLSVGEARLKIFNHFFNLNAEKFNISERALKSAEQEGIVVIDEIDKVCTHSDRAGNGSSDASGEGVQRDLLPIIEGSSIHTDYGDVVTDHMLFICSGAFHSVKPSDMIAELQGRLPVRVLLKSLTEGDFVKILTQCDFNLLSQQVFLMETEGCRLSFSTEAIRAIAKIAVQINASVQNTGARRLATVIEKLMEDISFTAPERFLKDGKFDEYICPRIVEERLSEHLKTQDLHRFIL